MHFRQRSRSGFEVFVNGVMHVHWTREVAVVFISRKIVDQVIAKTGCVVIVLVDDGFMSRDLFITQKPTKRQNLWPVVISMASYTSLLANFNWFIKTNNNRHWCFICKNKRKSLVDLRYQDIWLHMCIICTTKHYITKLQILQIRKYCVVSMTNEIVTNRMLLDIAQKLSHVSSRIHKTLRHPQRNWKLSAIHSWNGHPTWDLLRRN